MGFWNDWGLSLILVIAVAGVAFITSQLVERWVDRQEEIATRNLEADES
jgi:hypothetical protein